MTRNPNEIEQAVSRTLRDSLDKLQRTTEELNHAVNDLVSACASTRPTNSLPPMLRAQTAAASLSASLEVLSRFVTAALQPALRSPAEQQAVEFLEPSAPEVISETLMESQPKETSAELQASNMVEEGAPIEDEVAPEAEPIMAKPLVVKPPMVEPMAEEDAPVTMEFAAGPSFSDTVVDLPPETVAIPVTVPEPEPQRFDVSALDQPNRDLHKRADRVAKVAMQDIKMLRPEQVKLGKEHKDLCTRLQDDIEKAHKEYDRRFHAILDHPVDYFYKRMVEILGDGDAEALGKYPYSSPVLRR